MFYYILNKKMTSQSLLNFCIEQRATGQMKAAENHVVCRKTSEVVN